VTTLLVSHRYKEVFGNYIIETARSHGITLELAALPPGPEGRIDEATAARVEIGLFSSDVYPAFAKQYFSATRATTGLKWLHLFNTGVDHPVYASILQRGVRMTTSAGTTAEPIAQTAVAGLVMLARGFPRWLASQRERRWEPVPVNQWARDLRGQVVILYGVGNIGRQIARLARAFGFKIIGVDPVAVSCEHVDELHKPEELDRLLPGCDWLVLACPLTKETRGSINARIIGQLPRGAGIINVARGEIIDEPALVNALQSGHLGKAYLDVFTTEPLPADSPLWSMRDVIITPHGAANAGGNEARVNALFLDNLSRWTRGEPLINEITSL